MSDGVYNVLTLFISCKEKNSRRPPAWHTFGSANGIGLNACVPLRGRGLRPDVGLFEMFVVKRCRSQSRWKFPETHPSGADKLVYILAFGHTCREGVRTKTYRVSGQDENTEPSIHLSTLDSLLQQVSDLGQLQLSVENVVYLINTK